MLVVNISSPLRAHEGAVSCQCIQIATICMSQGKLEEKYRCKLADYLLLVMNRVNVFISPCIALAVHGIYNLKRTQCLCMLFRANASLYGSCN